MTPWIKQGVMALVVVALLVPGSPALPAQPDIAARDGTFASDVGVYRPKANPCVLFDTRHGSGKLAPGTTSAFDLGDALAQGGEKDCIVPHGAIAALVNIVAIKPGGRGRLKLFPSGGSEPKGATIHYSKLDPTLNVANALVVAQDDSGWKVKVAGAASHVQATILGVFFDGGNTFAAAGHDHGFASETASAVDVDQLGWNSIVEVEMAIPGECARPFRSSNNIEVTVSGNLDAAASATANIAKIGMWIDGTGHPDSGNPSGPRFNLGHGSIGTPFSHTWALEGIGAGIHTFEIKAYMLSSPYTLGEIDLVAKRLGWTCES